ncbi:hypothetical protein DdX_02517 [Ditylenchus destructor]|uniref:Uncharacterized protein n=1 Tax=Ditylenchus destructor TaxID=166010 RepID=A0AAD4R961_9BILA|nr:hypothetical protein DdX_02517 [Ditylenchus destructor]
MKPNIKWDTNGNGHTNETERFRYWNIINNITHLPFTSITPNGSKNAKWDRVGSGPDKLSPGAAISHNYAHIHPVFLQIAPPQAPYCALTLCVTSQTMRGCLYSIQRCQDLTICESREWGNEEFVDETASENEAVSAA